LATEKIAPKSVVHLINIIARSAERIGVSRAAYRSTLDGPPFHRYQTSFQAEGLGILPMISTGTYFHSHLLPILFIYGLSFFCLGVVVFVQNTSRSGLQLRRFIWLFAAFGLLHGMSEWSDMFLTLGRVTGLRRFSLPSG
jgi:hypothetical protein